MALRFISIFFAAIGTLAVILFAFSNNPAPRIYPLVSTELNIASSTPPETASTTPPIVKPAETATPTKAPITKPKQTLKPVSQTPTSPLHTENSLTKPAPITLNTDELYAMYEPAVLNIWCIEGNRATSGTATIVHPAGILITNAHIIRGIKDFHNCVLRKANPFENIAEFELLYMPNQDKLIEGIEFPRNDFAFLKITKAFNNQGNASWPSMPLSFKTPEENSQLFIFGYGTEFVGFDIAVKGIPLTFSSFTVSNLATVDEDMATVEAILLNAGLSAQSGSSGGPLVDFEKHIVALMSFVTKAPTTGERRGAAILISYVNTDLKQETGMDLKTFLDTHGAEIASVQTATSTPQ